MFFLKELENNKKEARMLMHEIKNLLNKIVEKAETFVQSNITTHEVNALQAIYTGLFQRYGILKKFFLKDAAPPNSIAAGNLNITNGTGNNYTVINNYNIKNFNHDKHLVTDNNSRRNSKSSDSPGEY